LRVVDIVDSFKFVFTKQSDPFQKKKWAQLHQNNYHPPVDEIVKRITDMKTKKQSIVNDWQKVLGEYVDVKDKSILEIGFGGGWFLAQMLYDGAKNTIGIEIENTIISRAIQAFEKLGLKNYQFYEIDDNKFLQQIPSKSIDIMYEAAVFQHTLKDITEKYMMETSRLLRPNGIALYQFLINNSKPIKQPSSKKEGIMYYSHEEIKGMIQKANLKIYKYGDYEQFDDGYRNWRLYMIQTN